MSRPKCYITLGWKGLLVTKPPAYGPIRKVGRKFSVVNKVPPRFSYLVGHPDDLDRKDAVASTGIVIETRLRELVTML